MITEGPLDAAPLEQTPAFSQNSPIQGTGEMAERVRQHDWSATSLGPIEGWSKELTAMVNLTLATPFPARTLWGPELILIYNDRYKGFPGKRHPEALGKPARDVYQESWHVVGPLLEDAYAKGVSFCHEQLCVPLETDEGLKDFYLDYAYSPVFEDGRVAGLFGMLHDVTGEVSTVRTLRKNEARSHRILQSIGDAVIVLDPEMHIVQMNPVAESLIGLTSARVSGLPVHDVFQVLDEVTREPIENPVVRARRDLATVKVEHPMVLVRQDNTEIAIDDSAAPIFDDMGNLAGIVLAFRDVHERRSIERDRTSIAKQLELVLRATTDGVLSIDRSWTMTYCNQKAEEVLRASGPLMGRNFWSTFPEAICEGSLFVKYYYRAMDQGIAGKFEAFYPQPLNAWYAVHVQPAEHGIVVFFRDITSQRQEAQVLQEREAKLKAIYSTTLEYIGLLTPDGVLIECNRASLEFAGNKREDVLGQHFADTAWFAHTPGAPDAVREGLACANAGETYRRELSLVRPDGEVIVFDFSMTPVRDESGKVIYIVPEGRDITEVKRTESALMKSEKLAAVGRLASSIAHEINNPLESVMNLIYLARHAPGPDSHHYLQIADDEIRRVSIIANQTLRFHKQASSPQATSGEDLFSTVLSIYEGRLRSGHVQIEKQFRTDEMVVCFQGDVRQVLNNLVSNALEAMPFGGRLLIRSRKGRNWKTGEEGVVLTVADNGMGIPPNARKHIFEAFFTTKGTAGNGLGLWVCQEIVARHHGTLRVRSSTREGCSGTAFCLFLPFRPPSE